MSESIIGVDLAGKHVVVRLTFFRPDYRKAWAESWCRVFKANGGFGCSPDAMGTKVFGEFIRDGEQCHIRRHDVERLATDDEVKRCSVRAIARENGITID